MSCITVSLRQRILKPFSKQSPATSSLAPTNLQKSHRSPLHPVPLLEFLLSDPLFCSRQFSDETKLPMEPHQQEVDAPHHHVLEVVARLVVLKLDVQAVLYAHLHLCQWWALAGRREGRGAGAKMS